MKIIDGFISTSVNEHSNNILSDDGIKQEKKWDGQYSNFGEKWFQWLIEGPPTTERPMELPKTKGF